MVRFSVLFSFHLPEGLFLYGRNAAWNQVYLISYGFQGFLGLPPPRPHPPPVRRMSTQANIGHTTLPPFSRYFSDHQVTLGHQLTFQNFKMRHYPHLPGRLLLMQISVAVSCVLSHLQFDHFLCLKYRPKTIYPLKIIFFPFLRQVSIYPLRTLLNFIFAPFHLFV
jgi:hypothetical protein